MNFLAPSWLFDFMRGEDNCRSLSSGVPRNGSCFSCGECVRVLLEERGPSLLSFMEDGVGSK